MQRTIRWRAAGSNLAQMLNNKRSDWS